MDLIKLIDIDLDSSTVSESAHSEYDPTHTYTAADIAANTVYVSYEDEDPYEVTDRTPHEIYKSLADANLDNYPPDNPAKWSLIGATNRWRMFDSFVNTQTEDTTTIVVEIDASKTNSIGLFRLIGKTVTFTSTVDGTIKKTEIIDLDDSPVYDYYGYFFADFSYKSDIFWVYPYYYSDAVLKIEIEPYQSETKCGMCALGKSVILGKTQWNPHIGINDYSKKTTDDLGRTYLNQGNFAKRIDIDIWIENAEVDMVRRLLAGVRGLPILINANGSETNYESLISYCFWETFEIIIPGPIRSKCTAEFQGLI